MRKCGLVMSIRRAFVGSYAGLAPTPRLTNIVQTTAWGEVNPVCAAVHVSVRPPE